jgi:hypothetical protein
MSSEIVHYIRPEFGAEDRIGPTIGPFPDGWLQLTYGELRIAPDGDVLASINKDLEWEFESIEPDILDYSMILGIPEGKNWNDLPWSDLVLIARPAPKQPDYLSNGQYCLVDRTILTGVSMDTIALPDGAMVEIRAFADKVEGNIEKYQTAYYLKDAQRWIMRMGNGRQKYINREMVEQWLEKYSFTVENVDFGYAPQYNFEQVMTLKLPEDNRCEYCQERIKNTTVNVRIWKNVTMADRQIAYSHVACAQEKKAVPEFLRGGEYHRLLTDKEPNGVLEHTFALNENNKVEIWKMRGPSHDYCQAYLVRGRWKWQMVMGEEGHPYRFVDYSLSMIQEWMEKYPFTNPNVETKAPTIDEDEYEGFRVFAAHKGVLLAVTDCSTLKESQQKVLDMLEPFKDELELPEGTTWDYEHFSDIEEEMGMKWEDFQFFIYGKRTGFQYQWACHGYAGRDPYKEKLTIL